MSFWSALPFVRITIVFIIGILWAYYYPITYQLIGISWAIAAFCYLVLVVVLKRTKLYIFNSWVGITGLVVILLSGVLCFMRYKHKAELPLADVQAYVAVALEDAAKREDRQSVTVAIERVKVGENWLELPGNKVRLHISNPSILPINYGDKCMVLGVPQLITAPLNPNEFDYRAFLSQDNIYYQHRILPDAIKKIGYTPPSQFQALFWKMSRFCKNILKEHIPAGRERSIVLALVLGIKDELDYIIKDAYAGAGTMHVLAVSGLHVGILYWLLSLLLYRLNKSKKTKWIGSLFVLIGLWIYAAVTGLAPSVLRSALMFSFLIIGKLLRKSGNIFNILAASAFVLLVFKPTLIFSVSFQLSYLAVLGIVYLQPKIYRWANFKNIILRQLWLWTSVSLAAQLTTTPISLYYFHQFPTYFIFANWVVVPVAFLIFILGLSVLFTSWRPVLSDCIGWILGHVTCLVNQFVSWINSLPYSVIQNIHMPTPQLFLWYGLGIALLLFLYRKKFLILILASGCAFLIGIISIIKVYNHRSSRGVIFYSVPSHQVVGFFNGGYNVLLVDENFNKENKKFTYHIKPSQLVMGIHTNNQGMFTPITAGIPLQMWQRVKIGVWGQKTFVFIDDSTIRWPITAKKLDIDFLIIEQNSIQSLKHCWNSSNLKR